MTMKTRILSVVAAMAVAGCLAMPAQARTVTLVVTPNPATVGADVDFSGCGYGANKDISVWIEYPDATLSFWVGTRANAAGCFDTAIIGAPYPDVSFRTQTPGTYGAYIFYKHGSGVSDYGNGQPVADVDFQVT